MKKGLCIVLSLFLVLTIMSLVSANIFNDIGKLFRSQGNVPQAPQDVSVSVVGKRPVTIEVPILSAMPVEGTFVPVIFTANVSDPDGVNDINDTNVTTLISNGTTTRIGTCVWNQDINKNKANYSCSVNMQYWDPPSLITTWKLNVSATDRGNKTLITQSVTFNYNQLKSLTISPSSLSWASIGSGDLNQQSDNDPTIINNSGNYNGPISITAIDLKGDIDPSELIPANNFNVSSVSSLECTGITLANATSTSITGSNSNPGNLSAGSGAGQSQLYYCIPLVPLISSQTYSASGGSSWTILY